MTQQAAILEYLRKFGVITRAECMTSLGIMEVTPRLSELEKLGFEFSRTMVPTTDRRGKKTRMCEYRIAKYPEGWK